MRKNIKKLCGFCCITMLLFTSCCEGVDDSEKFLSDVTNAQLESPEIDNNCFTTVVNSDGVECIKVTWPLVCGAGGYLFNLSIIDDPSNPQILIKDSIIDGISTIFEKKEDTKYSVSIKTLGNDKLNNKEPKEASIFTYSTLVPAITIPEGEDIAEFINANIQVSDKEQAFELIGGKTYTLNSLANFDLNTVTFRGDKTNRPIVIVGEAGGLMTQGGLKVKFINFDCSLMTQLGLLTLSDTPSESISTATLGYIEKGATQNGYVIENTVMFQDCNFKNLTNGVLYGNKKNWSLRDFRIVNCILQLNNSGSNPIINLYGASNGLIKNLTIKNSTFYNLVDNGNTYFIRYTNPSNAQPKKIFGTDNSSTFDISYSTFCKTMSEKEFANNLANINTLIFNVHHNIFYDTYKINKLLSSQAKIYTFGNIIFGVSKSVDSSDTGKKDSSGNPYAILEDPMFNGPINLEFDLTKSKGGVGFTPSAPETLKYASGDPRWYAE